VASTPAACGAALWRHLRHAAVIGVAVLAVGGSTACTRNGSSTGARGAVLRADPNSTDEALRAAVARIVQSTTADDDDSLDASAAALAALGDPAISHLSQGLRNPDEETRVVTVQLLARTRHPQTSEFLLAALHDESWTVRLSAVEALALRRDGRAVAPLLELYERETDAQVRYECLTTLGVIGDPAAADLLIRETRNADPYARMWAMDALCQMRHPQAPALAADLLADPNPYVPKQVVPSCGELLDTPRGHEALIALALFSRDYQNSVFARQRLVAFVKRRAGAPELVEQIRRAGRKELNGGRATMAALLLGDIADPSATSRLIEALSDPNHWIRHQAAYDLGVIGNRRAVPALISALGDQHDLVAATAYDSLQRFADAGDEHARAAVNSYSGKRFEKALPR